MARRKKRKQLIPTVWLDWSEEVAGLFGLVPAEWTPPAKVRVCGTLRRSTWSARFRTPQGNLTTARVRLERNDAGGQEVVERSVSARYTVAPGAAS